MKKKKIKVLNLYACIGGNRLLWENCEVTAIELDEELAKIYKKRFPNDNVIVTDAHDYLLKNYMNYDFIWSSPPCPTHSKARNYNKKYEAVYPDMKLYEEIILLKTRFKGKFCVENVVPYYTPLIQGIKRGRHLYWTNFNLPMILSNRKSPVLGNAKKELKLLCEFHNIDISEYKGKQSKIKIARNLVDYEAGKKIFDTAFEIIEKEKSYQFEIFDSII
jgi:DNA (cytosine-5)-methyltransferase 1